MFSQIVRPTIVVKRYRSKGEFERDAREMNRKGYTILSTSVETPGRGCMFLILAALTLGLFLLLTRPKPVYVVTYQLAK